MRRSRITITLNNQTLIQVDKLIDSKQIRNRSHAIEYILNQYLKSNVKKAVILAGGQGTKMRPYTYEMPKALLPVKGRPLLEHIINQLKKNGITDIVICIGYLGDKIKQYFGNGEQFGVHITYSEEKEPLQTGGSLLSVKKLVQSQVFLVIHGDILTNLPIQDLINFHEKENSIATIALTTVNEPGNYGQLKLHGSTLVNFYQHNGDEGQAVKSNLINAGIYVCEPTIFDYFPKNKKVFLLEDVIESLVDEKKVSGFVFEDQWFDVGDPQNYEKAIKEYTVEI